MLSQIYKAFSRNNDIRENDERQLEIMDDPLYVSLE